MNRLKSRIDNIEKKMNGSSQGLVVLIGDNRTDFDKLKKQHIKRNGCNPDKTLFINLINRYVESVVSG